MILFLIYYFNRSPFKIINIGGDYHFQYNQLLKEHELRLQNWYPLGSDYFCLDHGEDYCKFFKRLGTLHMMVCQHDDKIIGTCAMILQHIPRKQITAWYLADLKIEPAYRGNKLPYYMITKEFMSKYLKSNKCYGITMDDQNKESKVLNISKKASFLNFRLRQAGKLYIYSIDYKLMKRLHRVLEIVRGDIFYLSLNGIKDLVLQSTLKPMQLLHLQWGKNKDLITEKIYLLPQLGYTHMFCLHEHDPLKLIFDKNNITTTITATIVQYGMDDMDWSFVLTSDI